MLVHPFFTLGRIAKEHGRNVADASFAAFTFFRFGDNDEFVTEAEGEGDVADICRLTCMERGVAISADSHGPLLRVNGLKIFVEWGPRPHGPETLISQEMREAGYAD